MQEAEKRILSGQKVHAWGKLNNSVMILTSQLSKTDQQFQPYSCKSKYFISHHKGKSAFCTSSQICQAALLGLLGHGTVKSLWYLFTYHCHPPWHRVGGHTRLPTQAKELWKAYFTLPVFSYKLTDIGFRKICQDQPVGEGPVEEMNACFNLRWHYISKVILVNQNFRRELFDL